MSVQRDYLSLFAWGPGTTISYAIHPTIGDPPFHVGDAETDEAGNVFVRLDEDGVDIDAGNFVTATDGALTVDVVARPVTIDVVDTHADVAEGTGPPGESVFVAPWGLEGTTAPIGLDGAWSADFSGAAPGLLEGTSAAVFLLEEGTDGGVNESFIDLPTIYAHLPNGDGHVTGTTPGGTVVLDVYEAPGEQHVHQAVLLADATGDAPFSLHEIGMWPGQYLVVKDAASRQVKTHVVRDCGVAVVDADGDFAAGWAWPGQVVTIILSESDLANFLFHDVVANDDGRWDADVAAAGYDLTPETEVKAHCDDAEGDTTVAFAGGDVEPPHTAIHTHHGAVVSRALRRPVEGDAFDERGWIGGVTVTFTPLRGKPFVVEADVDCEPLPSYCTWQAAPPVVPGVYHVSALASDSWGNVASFGPSIDVIAAG